MRCYANANANDNANANVIDVYHGWFANVNAHACAYDNANTNGIYETQGG